MSKTIKNYKSQVIFFGFFHKTIKIKNLKN